ncbi:ABC transporter ATP-binding protein [Herpetosiphon geysericola]|uniref:ABC transporter n=1 Tax=Herpetosiphon geysericola TaxID=70996 RepID=A0A0P6Y0L0_9CHLR|nr:ABC transporter ATP-binding protein [Herpetosiphon geysericola]KPL90916.1 ABC transporter [Herpetosiphon geysericola]
MNSHAVELRNVGKDYKYFRLNDISLSLPTGSITGFIGVNGAGKSTTIRILLGLVHQDRGSVQVLGQTMPDQQVLAKREIGYVSEDMRLYPKANLAWHMQFIQSIYPNWDQAYAEHLLKRFDLRAEQKIKGLSHGQRVKATLLLALAHRPKLLVLDEPTTGLDPVARQEVLSALMEVLADEQRTILFSSHNTLDVEQISDQVAFIDQGTIIEATSKEDLLDLWRRLRVRIEPGQSLAELPHIVQQQGNGQLQSLITNRYSPELHQIYQQAGLEIQAVEYLTLEEIFVASIQARREGKTL